MKSRNKLINFARIFLISLAFTCFIFSAFTFCACSGGQEQGAVTLVDWSNDYVTAELGSYYQLRTHASDNKGNSYNLTATVECDGEQVSTWDFSFKIEKLKSYFITYSCYVTDLSVTTEITVTNAVKQDVVFNQTTNDGVQVPAQDLSGLGFDASTSAKVYKIGGYSSGESAVKNLTLPQFDFDTAKTLGYTDIEIAFMFSSSNAKAVRVYSGAQHSAIIKNVVPVLDKWNIVRYDIDSFRNVVYNQDGTVKPVTLFSTYMSPEKRVEQDGEFAQITVYVAVYLCDALQAKPLEEGYLVQVHNELVLSEIYAAENDLHSSKTVYASELSSYGVSGEYTGNAVKLDVNALSQVRVLPKLEKQTLLDKFEGGDYAISFYVSAYADNGKSVKINSNNSIYTDKTLELSKTWQKITINLTPDLIDQLYDAQHQKHSLFGIYMTKAETVNDRLNSDGSNTVVHVFVSDIELVKIRDKAPNPEGFFNDKYDDDWRAK